MSLTKFGVNKANIEREDQDARNLKMGPTAGDILGPIQVDPMFRVMIVYFTFIFYSFSKWRPDVADMLCSKLQNAKKLWWQLEFGFERRQSGQLSCKIAVLKARTPRYKEEYLPIASPDICKLAMAFVVSLVND